ncbi:hypothetical protein RBU49_00015 [Clostridium sp. MB40-C1]|uniref:hypothetical protein n=1 Tax=Clostridium sp. MB40-C1 TaxID=3070996 RepID=UPI0027E020FC|nr:hypothetical protein [Clostridium sp. MB40-C1]WMJ80672.1 hypothetical protein RBU49_00015 [Clostridium sp. MB40-C1]
MAKGNNYLKTKWRNNFNYWKDKLENIDQNVEFPLDKKRPSMLTNSGRCKYSLN